MINFSHSFAALAVLFASVFLASGCQTHNVSYPVMNAQKVGPAKSGGKKTVQVDLFRDATPREPKITVRRGGQLWRTNGREGYPGGQISPGVSKMIARHLNQSRVFSRVKGPGSGGADLILKGTISEYSATGKINVNAEKAVAAGAIAGAPGAAIAGATQKGQTTEVFSSVRLSNVRLVDAQTGRTIWSGGNFSSSSSQKKAQFLKADADVLFRRADWELRRAVDKMARSLANAGL